MTEELTVYVDYIGKSYYGIFINDPCKTRPDHILTTVSASLAYISEHYGIDTHVEISHCVEIIFKLERNLDMGESLS